MNALILTFGSRGDVQPYVALGAALKERGHTVRVATGQGFTDLIEAHGLQSASFSVDVRELINTPTMQKAIRSWSGKFRAWREFQDTFRQQLIESWTIAQEAQPDVIIYHPKGTAAPHLGEKLGIPTLPAFVIPGMVPTTAFPSPLLPFHDLGRAGNWLTHELLLMLARKSYAKPIQQWRIETLGLEGEHGLDVFTGYDPRGRPVPRLHGYSAVLAPPPSDWPWRQDPITGYWFLNQVGNWTPPQDLEHFLAFGPPPVYVGFGSMPTTDAAGLTRLILEALAMTGRRGVLSLGWGGLEKTTVPENVHLLEEAPHDWLFPRCAAVVHHGGSGTTHEGLRWGCPSIVCPVLLDQPFWGRRVHGLGAGPEPIALEKLTAPTLAEQIKQALKPPTRERARTAGQQLQAEPGAAAAARIVEAFMQGEPSLL